VEDQCGYVPLRYQRDHHSLTETQALAGVMAYPLQGLYKTCYTAIHSQTRKEIAVQRLREGRYLYTTVEPQRPRSEDILAAFELLVTAEDPKTTRKASKKAEKERKKQGKLDKDKVKKVESPD
jgi:hypothetical protein